MWRVAATIGALALFGAPASAQPLSQDQEARDVRCLMAVVTASGVLMQQEDPRMKTLALMTGMSALYYLGRLEGRIPDNLLADRIKREVATMDSAQLKAEALRCGKEVEAVGERMKVLGVDLQAVAARPGV
jgi:hypothetical protein